MADESDKPSGANAEGASGAVEPNPTPATPPAPTAEDKRFTQSDLDRLIDERLKREREKAAKTADKARADAEAKALEEGNQFKELAEKRAAKIAELEAQTNELEAVRAKQADYEKTVKGYLKTEREGLSEPILALLDKLDPLDQLAWIAENKAKLQPLPNSNGKTQTSHVPATPPADNGKSLSEAELERRRKEFGAQVSSYF